MSFLNLFSSIVLIISISNTPIYAEDILQFKLWSFSSNPKPSNMPWLSSKAKKPYTKESMMAWFSKTARKLPKVTLGPRYFYVAPFYEGSHWASFFMPLQIGKHNFWWDTGSILLSSSVGYRYELNRSYLKQSWFGGLYIGHNYYGKYLLGGHLKNFFRGNVGVELGSSRLGQLTINYYGVLDKDLYKTCEAAYTYDCYRQKLRAESKVIDNAGVSAKWVSIPNTKGVQLSAMLACSQVQSKKGEYAIQFTPEYIWRFGTGFEFNIKSWAHLELQWTLFDGYQPFSFYRLMPAIGVKLIGAKSHLEKDKFQGRLARPPQYHAPLYADFSWHDCFSMWGKDKQVECACCLNDVAVQREVVHCDTNEHPICFRCIQTSAATDATRKTGNLNCSFIDGCESSISLEKLKPALGVREVRRLANAPIRAETEEAGVQLVECPSCVIPAQPDQGFDEFHCPCGTISCLKCQGLIHPNQTCAEARGGSNTPKARIERAMNEAYIGRWRCCKCNTPYEQDQGCNHLICKSLNCGAHMCSLCGVDITLTGYTHFKNLDRTRAGINCSTYDHQADTLGQKDMVRTKNTERAQNAENAKIEAINQMIRDGDIREDERDKYMRVGEEVNAAAPRVQAPRRPGGNLNNAMWEQFQLGRNRLRF